MSKIILNNRGLRKLVPYLEEKYPTLRDQLIIVDDHLRLVSDPDVEIIVRVPVSEATAPVTPVATSTTSTTTGTPAPNPMSTAADLNPLDPSKKVPKDVKMPPENPTKKNVQGAQGRMAITQASSTSAPAKVTQPNAVPQAQIMSKGPGGISPAAQVGRAPQKEKMGAEKQAMASLISLTQPGSAAAKRFEKELPSSVQRKQARAEGEKEKDVEQAITDLAAAISGSK
jgi:hypothetical protein